MGDGQLKEIKGDIFTTQADLICVTTNGIVVNGLLVMGAGIAKLFADRYPRIRKILGYQVERHGNLPHLFETDDHKMVCSFPTKHNYSDPSDMRLIRQSAYRLVDIVNMSWEYPNPCRTVLLPRPGCGLGGLSWQKDVKPVLEGILDDRFSVITP